MYVSVHVYMYILYRGPYLSLSAVGSILVDLRIAVSFEVRLVRLLRGCLAT